MKVQEFNSQPDNSSILKDFNGEHHFMDSFRIDIINTNDYSIDYLTALLFTAVPKWVKLLLGIRDFIVKPFGLKTDLVPEIKALDKSIRYNQGDRAVFFLVIDRSESEIVMAEDDKTYILERLYVFKRNRTRILNLFF